MSAFTCARCGQSFVPSEPGQRFCSAACHYRDQPRPAISEGPRRRTLGGAPLRPDAVFANRVVDIVLTCPACLTVSRQVGPLRGQRACTQCAGAHLVPADGFVEQALETAAPEMAARRERLGRRSRRYGAFGHSRGVWAMAAALILVAVVLLSAAAGASRSAAHTSGDDLLVTGLAVVLAAGAARFLASDAHVRRALGRSSQHKRFNPYRLDTGLGRYVDLQLRANDNLGHLLPPAEAMEALAAWAARDARAQQAQLQNLVLLGGLVALHDLRTIDRNRRGS